MSQIYKLIIVKLLQCVYRLCYNVYVIKNKELTVTYKKIVTRLTSERLRELVNKGNMIHLLNV